MAKHIIRFARVSDPDYPNPKDKLPWKTKDNRENKYECYQNRFIVTDKKKFIPPKKMPEEKWL